VNHAVINLTDSRLFSLPRCPARNHSLPRNISGVLAVLKPHGASPSSKPACLFEGWAVGLADMRAEQETEIIQEQIAERARIGEGRQSQLRHK